MIEYCLKPNPNAEKFIEAKAMLFKAKPEVENMNDQFVGRAWAIAKRDFKALTSHLKA